MGAEIQVEFEMPDPSEVAEVCGVTWHKKWGLCRKGFCHAVLLNEYEDEEKVGKTRS
jgi:hypothetical protein